MREAAEATVPLIGAPEAQLLLRYARACIRRELGGAPVERPAFPWADRPGATFVTLRWAGGELQGCIGSLEPRRALADDVAQNAVAAALYDPRARRLTLSDVDALAVELSLLSRLTPVAFDGLAGALAALRPRLDGVVLRWRTRRATFLPQMWEQLPDAREFLAALRRKAGLPPDFWAPDLELWRYSVDLYHDAAVAARPDPPLS